MTESEEGLAELWQDVTPGEKEQLLNHVDVEFDTVSGNINVHSKKVNQDGEALFDWNLDSVKGEVTELKREHQQVFEDVMDWKDKTQA